MQLPHTHGYVQSATFFALSGMKGLHAWARIGRVGLPDHLELTVGLHLADVHGLVQVVVLRVEGDVEPRGGPESLVAEGLTNGVDFVVPACSTACAHMCIPM